MNFSGGPIVATVDYVPQVTESNEGNNTLSGGTLGVKPKAPINLVNYPPFAAYGYTDQSNIETGFGVKLERRVGSCTVGSWSTSSPGFQRLEGALSGNSSPRQVAYAYTHGYCYRLKVTALGTYANSSEQTSSTFNYP
jgi:hypothetical protein